MDRSIYLINPREDCVGWNGMEFLRAWKIASHTNLADLTMPTVAALVPKDWTVAICDERIEPVDMETDAAVVGITGKVTQRARAIALAEAFRARGKLVVIGGPAATLEPDAYHAYADILVTGELEDIAETLFGDIAAGTYKDHYVGGRPDLSKSPIPRWDLYPSYMALTVQVQTSRGCPFECEFCDVIQYLGRKQRWKEPPQVVAELEELYALGHRQVFFADDNFTVFRKRARALLIALAAWNDSRPEGKMRFSTQVSVDLARDPELMALCLAANLRMVFVGIETPNADSLAETMKRQNLRIDLTEEVRKITASGLMVMCGLIVGFDHDGPDIFERQLAFAQSLPVPIIHFGTLVAPSSTPLYSRLRDAGRLANDLSLGAGNILETNIVPSLMSRDDLFTGSRWLLNHLYAPEAYAHRLGAFVAASPTVGRVRPRLQTADRVLLDRLARLGVAEMRLAKVLLQMMRDRPDLMHALRYCLFHYCQARYLLGDIDVWDPELARRRAPLAA